VEVEPGNARSRAARAAADRARAARHPFPRRSIDARNGSRVLPARSDESSSPLAAASSGLSTLPARPPVSLREDPPDRNRKGSTKMQRRPPHVEVNDATPRNRNRRCCSRSAPHANDRKQGWTICRPVEERGASVVHQSSRACAGAGDTEPTEACLCGSGARAILTPAYAMAMTRTGLTRLKTA